MARKERKSTVMSDQELNALKDRQRNRGIIKRMKNCQNFTGVSNASCKVGYSYDTFRNRRMPLPCLPTTDQDFLLDATDSNGFDSKLEEINLLRCEACPDAKFMTRDEATKDYDRWKEDADAAGERMRKIRDKIMEMSEGKKSVSGGMVCPACGQGRVSFYVAFNGHVSATCTTKGCASWME